MMRTARLACDRQDTFAGWRPDPLSSLLPLEALLRLNPPADRNVLRAMELPLLVDYVWTKCNIGFPQHVGLVSDHSNIFPTIKMEITWQASAQIHLTLLDLKPR